MQFESEVRALLKCTGVEKEKPNKQNMFFVYLWGDSHNILWHHILFYKNMYVLAVIQMKVNKVK